MNHRGDFRESTKKKQLLLRFASQISGEGVCLKEAFVIGGHVTTGNKVYIICLACFFYGWVFFRIFFFFLEENCSFKYWYGWAFYNSLVQHMFQKKNVSDKSCQQYPAASGRAPTPLVWLPVFPVVCREIIVGTNYRN